MDVAAKRPRHEERRAYAYRRSKFPHDSFAFVCVAEVFDHVILPAVVIVPQSGTSFAFSYKFKCEKSTTQRHAVAWLELAWRWRVRNNQRSMMARANEDGAL